MLHPRLKSQLAARLRGKVGDSHQGGMLTLWGSQYRLDQGDDRGHPILEIDIFSLDLLLGAYHSLQLLVGLLRGQVVNPLLQGLDLILSPLTDGSLRLSVYVTENRAVSNMYGIL